jgi:hypothetical protein
VAVLDISLALSRSARESDWSDRMLKQITQHQPWFGASYTPAMPLCTTIGKENSDVRAGDPPG